mmetsp:Transcript_14015/g.40255  ORF Transcript_14015/g.40255 Transcript_14015/m.40255 type:complete len:142 (+) Transcript_14015:1095-1520(+)
MKENEDADLSDNPEVADTIMADMSANWEVPTPEEVVNLQVDNDEIPEQDLAVDEAGDAPTDATAEKSTSTGTITGDWAVGQDHRNKQASNPQATATAPAATSATGEKPKSQGTIAGEWAVCTDHKMKQSRRPSSEGRGYES